MPQGGKERKQKTKTQLFFFSLTFSNDTDMKNKKNSHTPKGLYNQHKTDGRISEIAVKTIATYAKGTTQCKYS